MNYYYYYYYNKQACDVTLRVTKCIRKLLESNYCIDIVRPGIIIILVYHPTFFH